MPSMKAIVTNTAGIIAKYGAPGAVAIDAAISRLITADALRGFSTVVFDLSDAADMQALNAVPVVSPKDEAGAKRCVDALHAAHQPDYIMLLDGPDVVPHIALNRIYGVNDSDTTTDSDLPYASPSPFSRDASDYLAVTRVVGRLPAASGETDPTRLISLIEASIAHTPCAAEEMGDYFAISTDKWKVSTQLSLSTVFGGHALLFISPTDTHSGIDAALAHSVQLINCHGATHDWRFYGEKSGTCPVAMQSSAFAPISVRAGAIVAAECCYGAQLFDYHMAGVPPPLCLTYLWKGACGVMGSTNISYGPAASNGQADFMAQYFLQEVLKGASTGRAMLQARQSFVQNQVMSGHLNLKTLAQFLLLGDPSLHPVTAVAPPRPDVNDGADDTLPKAFSASAPDASSERRYRRFALDSEGRALASFATRTGEIVTGSTSGVDSFTAVARAHGVNATPEVFFVTGGEDFKSATKTFGAERKIAIGMAEAPSYDSEGRVLFTSYRAIVGHMIDDVIFKIEECESR